MCANRTMGCQPRDRLITVHSRSTDPEWRARLKAPETVVAPGFLSSIPRAGRGTLPRRPSRDVVLESELRRIRLSLIGPADTTLHLLLDAVEGVDFNERVVLPPFDTAVQPGESTIHGVAQNVGNRLARPCAPRLRPVPISVELLADLRDPLALEVPAENQGHDPGFLNLDLEDALDIVVAVRTRVGEECVGFLHGVVERLDALQPTRAAEDLALVQVALRAEFLQRLLLGLRSVMLKELARRAEAHVDFPEKQGVRGGTVRAMLAQDDLLSPDRRIRAGIRIDLVAHEVLRAPAAQTTAVHAHASRRTGGEWAVESNALERRSAWTSLNASTVTIGSWSDFRTNSSQRRYPAYTGLCRIRWTLTGFQAVSRFVVRPSALRSDAISSRVRPSRHRENISWTTSASAAFGTSRPSVSS